MEYNITSFPLLNLQEYLLVLSPHEELWNRIVKTKEEFADQYKSDQARWGKPHITLVNFVQSKVVEERIINRLDKLSMAQTPFKVELKDFGSFPSHTIYINVMTKVPVQDLVKSVRTETQRLMKLNDEMKPHFIMEPHLTIGRKLKPWQYDKAWLEYSHKHFTGRFIADHMILLRRQYGEGKYHILKRFNFQNMPISVKQGALFG